MMRQPKLAERPWGRYREYARNEKCTVWMVEMNPGEEGSLQSHRNFDEVWILLTSGGEVQLEDEIVDSEPYKEIFIPRGTRHRLRNPTEQVLRMMEVVYGEVIEDDKIRYEDKYRRG
jgi:mannose-1-phosphate guanylyltransferase/mannose-6-phosphate isomerase